MVRNAGGAPDLVAASEKWQNGYKHLQAASQQWSIGKSIRGRLLQRVH